MQYSNQLIAELCNNLNSVIITFFEQKHNILKFPVHSTPALVESALNKYFKGASNQEDLIPIINNIKQARLRKRIRWFNSLMNDISNLSSDDPKFPFANIVSLAQSLPTNIYIKLYSNKTVDELIQEEIQKAKAWRKDPDFLLIEFPALSSYTTNAIFQSLIIDVIFDLWKYIKTELNGSISSYLLVYPEPLVDKPLFSPTPVTLAMQSTDNILKDIITDENEHIIMETTIKGIDVQETKLISPKALSAFDLKVLNAIIMSADMNVFYKDRTVVVSFSTLCNHIIDYRPSKQIYKKIEEACEKLIKYNYTYIVDEDYKTYFNLVDQIDVDSKKKQISCIFGELISNALIQQKLVTITSPVYSVLHNNLSSIICYALKKEQISNQNSLVGEYTYIYFQKIVRFKSNKKKVNIKLLKESLQEFVDNKVIVESFFISATGIFTIHFFKLSDAELSDLGLKVSE